MGFDYKILATVALDLELLSLCPYEQPGRFDFYTSGRLERLAARDLVECQDGMWRCTAKGMNVLDTLMSKQVTKVEDLAEKMLPRRIRVANDNRKKK